MCAVVVSCGLSSLGAVSGYYLWKEPLEKHFRERQQLEQQGVQVSGWKEEEKEGSGEKLD